MGGRENPIGYPRAKAGRASALRKKKLGGNPFIGIGPVYKVSNPVLGKKKQGCFGAGRLSREGNSRQGLLTKKTTGVYRKEKSTLRVFERKAGSIIRPKEKKPCLE